MDQGYSNPYVAFMDGAISNDYNRMNAAMKKEPENPFYQPPVSQENDYNAMNADIAEQQQEPLLTPPQQEKRNYLDEIMNHTPPKPVYDQERQNRLKQISKVSALGDVLKTVGDTFALSKGGNVIARGPNQDVIRNHIAWQNYDDMYNQRLDQYNRDVFQNRLNNLRYGMQMQYQTDRDKKRDEKETERFNWQKDIQEKQFKSLDEDRKERRENQKKDDELRREMFKHSKEMDEKRYGLEASRFNLAKNEAEKAALANNGLMTDDKDNIILAGDKMGEEIRIDKRYRDHILALIVGDELLTDKDMDLLKPSMGETVTTEQKNFMIAKYWKSSPAVQKWLSRPRTNAGEYTEADINAVRDMALGRSVAPEGSQSFKTDTNSQTPTKNPFDF